MNKYGQEQSGAYDAVFRRMLDSLATVTAKTRDKLTRPLAGLNRAARHDFTLSLLSGWAVVADIVRFYRDRITDEGYLSSAIEDRSVYYLGRLLGYRKWPGEASATWLALTVSSTNLPQQSVGTGVVSIPAGGNLVVQNIPSAGALPVVFESHDAVEAHAEWNDLRPFTDTPSPVAVVFNGMTGMRLAGQVTSLHPGSSLLIQTETQSFFRLVDQVQIQQGAPFTFITWSEPLRMGTLVSERILSVSTFRQQAALFGRKAPAWSAAPNAVRQKVGTRAGGILSQPIGASAWQSSQTNLPPLDVQSLAVGPNGQILAGTSKGLYANPRPGGQWTAMPTSPAQQSVLSIFVNDLGFLYTGGTRGAVSLSTDNGQNWQSLRGPVTIGNEALDGKRGIVAWIKRMLHIPSSPKRSTPSTSQPPASLDCVIRALDECTSKKTRYLLAGTDRGILFLRAGGLDWTTYSRGLPGYNSATGLCSTVVFSLYSAPSICVSALFAGTESGLYMRRFEAHCWKQIHLPAPSSQPKVFALAEYNRQLFVGTSHGLYTSNDGKHWMQVSAQNLPTAGCFRSLSPYTHDLSSGLLAATDHGAWLTTDGGTTWRQLACQEWNVFCLNVSFAAELDKCDLSPALVTIFMANGFILPEDAKLKVIRPGAEWQIYSPAENECFGFMLQKDSSSIRVHQKVALSTADIRLVSTLPTGEFLLASPTGEFLENDWPGFRLCSSTIALDRIVSDLQPGTDIVLHQDQPQSTTIFAKVEDVAQRPIQKWGRQATVSIITLSNVSDRLELLRQRDAILYCKPAQLTASELESSALTPISGDSIRITGAIPSLGDCDRVAIVGKPPIAVLPVAGGVFVQQIPDPGSQSKVLPFTSLGLDQENITALASGGGFLWAFAEGVGLYYRTEHQTQPAVKHPLWQPVPGSDAPTSATCLIWLNHTLWVGTNGRHIYQCRRRTDQDNTAAEDPSWEWRQDTTAPAEILSIIADNSGALYVGTSVLGVFKRSPASGAWTQLTPQLSLKRVLALSLDSDGTLYVGAAQGVYQLDTSGEFRPIGAPSARESLAANMLPLKSSEADYNILNVTALAIYESTIYAGTAQGEVCSLSLPSGNWTFVSAHRLKAPISTLARTSPVTLLVATRGSGICTLSIASGLSTPITYSASNDITAMLGMPSGMFLTAASNTSILSTRDPSRHNAQRSPLFLASIAFAAMLDLQTVPPDLVAAFLRHIPTFANPCVSTVIRGQCWVIRSSDLSFLLHIRDFGLKSAQIAVEQIDTFVAFSCEEYPARNYTQWNLGNGFQSASIKLSEGTQEILLCPALPGVRPHGEVAEVASTTLSATTEATQLTLKKHLSNLYDPNVTTLNANLAYATQGVTVPLEILGSGNAAVTHQSFPLKRPPVTYAHRQPQDKASCSLQVYVNSSSSPNAPPPSAVSTAPVAPKPSGELWKQVPSFFGVAASENAYTFTIDAEGNNIVQFGDGIQGSRLPTGVDNVATSYRTGIGTEGNVDAGSLVVFRKRPLGIRSVSNPVPATGGENPESFFTSREKMKQWTFALDRIVSLHDYLTFCLAKPDILKAHVTQLPEGTTHERIRITLATRDRLPLKPDDAAYTGLLENIRTASARAYPFAIDGFENLYFQLKVQITVSPLGDTNNLRQSVIDALLAAFSFEKRAFAQSVTAEEIISVIQPLPSVEGVSIPLLYLRGELPANFHQIAALPTRWDARSNTVRVAQILLFDPSPDAATIEFVEPQ